MRNWEVYNHETAENHRSIERFCSQNAFPLYLSFQSKDTKSWKMHYRYGLSKKEKQVFQSAEQYLKNAPTPYQNIEE